MIKSVGDKQLGQVSALRVGLERSAPAAKAAGEGGNAQAGASVTASAELASKGAPVDTDRVAALRAAIAGGHYSLDSTRIAGAMIAFGEGAGA